MSDECSQKAVRWERGLCTKLERQKASSGWGGRCGREQGVELVRLFADGPDSVNWCTVLFMLALNVSLGLEVLEFGFWRLE